MEKQFVLHGRIPVKCVLTEPEWGQVRRIVLGVHGLAGSTADEIQQAMAEEMALFGAAMVRFDFPAHGESPVDCEGFTLENCVDSLLTVARWAREEYPGVEDLCVFATGFGGYVTLNALEELQELPGRVKLVLHTPSVRMDETLLAMLGRNKETFWALDSITIPTPRPLQIRYSFYEELHDHVVMNAYHVPMLILRGETDAFIRYEDLQSFRRINEGAKLVTIPGATHRFLEDGAWFMVLDLVRDWFLYETVTLTDWE